MKLAIVEDEKIHLEYLIKMLEEASVENNIPISISTYESAESFQFHYEEENYDAILLDIKMKNLNGYKLAEIIRDKDKEIPIAFITGEKDYVFKGYNVDACGYILKPIEQKEVSQLLLKINEKLKHTQKTFFIKTKEGTVNIYENSIKYIESSNHNTRIKVEGKEYLSSMKLGEWEKELSQDYFFKTHRSFIVNFQHIEKLEKKNVIIREGGEVPIARGKWEELMKSYLQYRRKENS